MPSYFHYRNEPDNIQWDGKMNVERCRFHKTNGERCKRNIIIGLDYCFQHRITKYNVKVKDSEIQDAGKGLFANNGTSNNDVVFHKGDKIVPYNGELVAQQIIRERYGNKTAPYGLSISKDRATDGALHRGIGTLINHPLYSRFANTRFSIQRDQQEVNIVADKNIKNNQELYVPYGRSYRFETFERDGTRYSTNGKMKSV